MAPRTLDVPRDDAGGALGVLPLHARDQLAMLLQDRLPAGAAERDPRADGAQDLAMAPPHVDGVAIVVAVVHDAVKTLVAHAVGVGIVEPRRFDLCLDRLQPRDVLVARVVDEPARHIRLEQRRDLVDVADEVIVDRPDAALRGCG